MNERGQFVVVGLGEIWWDLQPEGKQLGGMPANFGDDDLGRQIRTHLAARGLETLLALHRAAPTGTVTLQPDAAGVLQPVIRTPAAWDGIPFTTELLRLAAHTDAVCFGTLGQRAAASRQTLGRFLDATSDQCWRILDVNLQDSVVSPPLDDLLELANVLQLREADLPQVARRLGLEGTPGDIITALRGRPNLKLIALTRGHDGSRLFSAAATAEYGPSATPFVNPAGADGAFTAALAMGLLHGYKLDTLQRNAGKLAAYGGACKEPAPALPPALRQELSTPAEPGPGNSPRIQTSPRLTNWMNSRLANRGP